MKTKEKINNMLEELSKDILTTAGCAFCWSEVEVPTCLKQELEKMQKLDK